jgi:hypothetical protein
MMDSQHHLTSTLVTIMGELHLLIAAMACATSVNTSILASICKELMIQNASKIVPQTPAQCDAMIAAYCAYLPIPIHGVVFDEDVERTLVNAGLEDEHLDVADEVEG